MIIVAFVVIALVAGFVANWLVGRGRGYETWELFVAGIVGSFVGGFIFNLFAGNGFDFHITGLIGSTSAPSSCWHSTDQSASTYAQRP